MKDNSKTVLMWLLVIGFILMVLSELGPRTPVQKKTYTEFSALVNNKEVKSVTIENFIITGELTDGKKFETVIPSVDPDLRKQLTENNIEVTGVAPKGPSFLTSLLFQWPLFLIILLYIYSLRQMQGGGGGGRGGMPFGRSRARMMDGRTNSTTFKDVAGCDEAKEEVQEFVDFLSAPKKFQNLGGKIPCGALLVGPPGTGKTLLAKAVAGEAGVPFFTISGSDFVEMFVGVGASRVRDMFDQAKRQAPCIIFIDEIDAVGRHRGAGLGGGHDEREQTLNQLLVEMDGFEGKEGVIVMAATNRPDVLDPALLRPGRFDRQVVVPLPDIKGREQILNVHMAKITSSKDAKASILARGTPGFSGADLANLVNEAALFAARLNKRKVTMDEFEKAKDKIMMGAERKSMVMNEQEKLNTAYHESGHAIVGMIMPEHDPVYKVSIIPRGMALGVTMYLPEEDRHSYSLQKLESMLASLFGGRAAELIIFGERAVTTGASNDIERATEIARNIVTRWGLSKRLGPINYGSDDSEVFLGKSINKSIHFSGETARMIDEEVREIIGRSYQIAKDILEEHIDQLHAMAKALMKYETIDTVQIKAIMKNKDDPESKEKEDSSEQTKKKETKKDDKEK